MEGKNHTMDSLGIPDTATLKSPKLSLFVDWDGLLVAWLPEGLLDDDVGNIRTGLVPFCDLNHCTQLSNLCHNLGTLKHDKNTSWIPCWDIDYWFLLGLSTSLLDVQVHE